MRVLFLAHAFPRHEGDVAGSFLLRLAVALRAHDVEVQAVVPSGPGLPAGESVDGVAVRRFRYAPRRRETLAYTGNMAEEVRGSLAGKLALLSFLAADARAARAGRRSLRPDVVHAHWWFPGGLAATLLGGAGPVPVVTTLHGSDVRLARGTPAAHPVMRAVLGRSAAVTAVSSWLAREAGAIAPGREIQVAPMPVEGGIFEPGGGPRADARLLFVGRLTDQKGVDHLLNAMARLPAHVTLDIVGDGPARPRLERVAGELALGDRVRWLGTLPSAALRPRYQAAAALVLPSVEEGLGLVAVEAQLCGAPVIASNSGGIPDVVQHERTGLLVPPADPDALAAAVTGLLAREDRGRPLGEAGRRAALDTFSPDAVARRYRDVYAAALARRSR